MKKTHICKYCGSDEVLFDALAEWDEKQQKYVLGVVYEVDAYCPECDGETTTEEKEIL